MATQQVPWQQLGGQQQLFSPDQLMAMGVQNPNLLAQADPAQVQAQQMPLDPQALQGPLLKKQATSNGVQTKTKYSGADVLSGDAYKELVDRINAREMQSLSQQQGTVGDI